MKNLQFMRRLLWLSFIPFFLWSCEDKMEEHYEVPGWVKGSVWELLEEQSMEGQYSMFLEAADIAGYRDIMNGRSLMTVMAPDNKAFTTYLSEHGYGTVKDVPIQVLKELIGFHLLYYSYNKGNMENFRPEGEGAYDEGTEILDPGMYYKFRTRSSGVPTKEIDPLTGKTVTVYHLERFIPAFSHYFFSSKNIDAKKNYEYFYPQSTWTGDGGFNVSEASVKEYALIANNGYVYTIDKVLEPLGSIYDQLKENPKYSQFLAIYNKFSVYLPNDELTQKYGEALNADTLYLHSHKSPLAPIAMEWYKYDYQRLDTLAYRAYSLFAPTNEALNTFFSNYWKGSGYENYENLDPLIQTLFLNEYVYSGSVVFPEEITKGTIMNASGVKFNFDPYTLKDKKMCVNGSFYGLDKIDTPILFSSVSGPTFKEKRFINFLYAMNTAKLLSSFGSTAVKYTLLVPKNEAFESSGITLNYYAEGGKLQSKPEGEWKDVSSEELQNVVRAHTVMDTEVELKKQGTQIIPIQTAFNYWFVKDGKITCSNQFNSILEPGSSINPFVSFAEITNSGKAWSNGKAYTYDAKSVDGLFNTNTEDVFGMQKALAICEDARYPYYLFAQLLKKADMVSGELISGLSGRTIVFVPTNETLKAALENKLIPGATNITVDGEGQIGAETAENKVELKKYISNYFLVASAVPTACYPGSGMKSGEYVNYSGETIIYTDHVSSLSIQLKKNNRIVPISGKYNYFPFCYNDGCFHFIESLLM